MKKMVRFILNLFIDGASKQIVDDYEKFAKENKGMFRIGSVDC